MFSPLIIEHIGVQRFKLYEDIIYEDDEFIITLLKGFEADGASTPSFLWSIIGCPFGEKYTRAAFFHDMFYRSGVFSRKMSDYIFLKMMLADGVDRAKARAMYLGVRAAGSSSYLGMGSPAKFREFIQIEIKG